MSRRIRILLAIGSLGGGGSERQLIGILNRLDRSRFEPRLYLLQRSGEFLDAVPGDVPVTAFSDAPSGSHIYLPGRVYRQQVRHLAATLTNDAIDVLYDRTALMTLVSGPASQRAGVPLVSTIVSNPELDWRVNITRFRWLKRRILTRAYRNAASVVANSESLRQAIVAFYGLDPARTRMIANGFDFERIRRLADAPDSAPPRDDSTFHIIALGRLQTEKRFGDLIESVRILVRERGRSNVRLTIAGQGPDEPELRRLIEHGGLGEHVALSGFVSNPFRLLRQADVLCLSSACEGMPNVLVEAMACDVPVIATDCPYGPREILDDGRLGKLVPIASPSELANALELAISVPATVADLNQARTSVEARFQIAARVAELEAVLDSAVTC